MRIHRFSYGVFTAALLLMPLLILDGCSDSVKKPKRPVVSKSMQAEQRVLTLTLAELALENNPKDTKVIAQYVKTLNTQAAAKTKTETETVQPVLVMEYTLRGQSEPRTLLVPVVVGTEMPAFKPLRQVQGRLGGLLYTLRDLRAYYVTVTWPPMQKFSTGEFAQQIAAEKQHLLTGALPLSPYENAQLQLQLTQFFLKTRMRDAAYLALENAKDSLAMVAEEMPSLDIAALSQRASDLELRLHKEMPYKI